VTVGDEALLMINHVGVTNVQIQIIQIQIVYCHTNRIVTIDTVLHKIGDNCTIHFSTKINGGDGRWVIIGKGSGEGGG
jgi:hypothetical protein